MKNLFEAKTQAEINNRLCLLKKDTKAVWGKMNTGQMLAHCCKAFEVPLSQTPPPRLFMGKLIGWAIKSKVYDDSVFAKNLPTAKEFIVNDERDFEAERKTLLSMVDKFYVNGPEKMEQFCHPMFGKLTAEQWGKFMYKHLDHHLRQFGV